MLVVVSLLVTILPFGAAYVWAVASFPGVARVRRRLLFTLLTVTFVGAPLQWLVVRTHWVAAILLQTGLVGIVVVLALASLPLLALRLTMVLVARARHPDSQPDPLPSDPNERALSPSRVDPHAKRATMTRRQSVEAVTGATMIGVAGAALGWGIARGRHSFEVREVIIRLRRLPRALDGYVIAQVSDIHTGVLVGERLLDEGLAHVQALRPDLVVATGDLVDIDARFAPLVARKLAELPARDGVVAILGNHDYYAGADEVAAAMRAAGVGLLRDEARVIRPRDGGGFALLGVDDLSSRRFGRSGPLLARALAEAPPDLARILLSHQPPTVDDWAGQVDVQLSGHTHGGQINPGGRLLAPMFEYVAGRYTVGGTTLYVNRGFGTVGPPARIGVPPEITRVVLVAG